MNKLTKIFLIPLLLTIFSLGESIACGFFPFEFVNKVYFFDYNIGFPAYWKNFYWYGKLEFFYDRVGKQDYPYYDFFYEAHFIDTVDYGYLTYLNNLKIWKRKLNNEFTVRELYDIIYKKTIYDYVDYLGNFKKSKLINRLKTKYPEFLEYLIEAKTIEVLLNRPNPWFYDYDTALLKKHLQIVLRKADSLTIRDTFWFARYSYQALVISFYLKDFSLTEKIYNQNILPAKDSLLIKWSKVYLARILIKKHDFEKAYKILLDIFEDIPAKQAGIIYLINSRIADSISNKFNKRQYAYYLAVKTLKKFNKQDFYKVIKSIPNSTIARFLITYHLKNINTDLYLLQLHKWNKDSLKISEAYIYRNIKDFAAVFETLKNKIKDKDYFYLLAASLYNMIEKPKKALYYNSLAKKYLKNEADSFQFFVNQAIALILELKQQKGYNPYFTPQIQNILKRIYNNGNISCFTKNAVSFTISRYFFDNGDLARFGMMFTKYKGANFRSPKFVFDYYKQPTAAKKLISLYKNPKGFLEKYFLDVGDTLVFDLYEYLGTTALRKYDYSTAVKYFKLVPEKMRQNVWYSYKHNPFNCSEDPADTLPRQSKKFNDKLYFAQELINILNSLRYLTGDEKAEKLRQLGNVYYNTSYLGRNWDLVAYGWSVRDLYYYNYYDKDINDNYRTCNKAIKYYNLAFQNAKSEKLKAQILYDKALALKRKKEMHLGYNAWKMVDTVDFSEVKALLRSVYDYDKDIAELYQKQCPFMKGL